MLAIDNYNEFKSKNLQKIYNSCLNNGFLNEAEMEKFSSLTIDEYLELLNLSIRYEIEDVLMPYFFMNYNNDIINALKTFLSDKKINNLLLESWNIHFHKKPINYLNKFYLFIPIFSSDLIFRISSAIDNDEFYNEFYEYIKEYSKYYIDMITEGTFFYMFDINEESFSLIDKKNENNIPETILNLKYNIEFFYYTQSYLNNNLGLLSSKKDKLIINSYLEKSIILYPYIQNPKLFFTNKDIKKIMSKKQDSEDTEKQEVSNEKTDNEIAEYTIQSFFSSIKNKLFNNSSLQIKESGAIECQDGHFRKPTEYSDIITYTNGSSNAFPAIVILFIVFSIFGMFSLKYLDQETNILTQRTIHTYSNNVNERTIDNIELQRIKE